MSVALSSCLVFKPVRLIVKLNAIAFSVAIPVLVQESFAIPYMFWASGRSALSHLARMPMVSSFLPGSWIIQSPLSTAQNALDEPGLVFQSALCHHYAAVGSLNMFSHIQNHAHTAAVRLLLLFAAQSRSACRIVE